MAIQKMFVHYAGTKEQFIAAGGATTYANQIVFINGGTSGNTCIFAQGSYFGNFAELLAAINYVKGVNVGGQNYNAAQGGGYVAFTAADPSTVNINAGQSGVEIGLTTAFITKVNDTATNLGSKTDVANKDGSAFARIANLAALVSDLTGGSTESVAGQIGKAIDALRTEILGTVDSEDSTTFEQVNESLDALGITFLNTDNALKEVTINGKAIYTYEGTDGPHAQEVVLKGGDIVVGGTSSIKDSTVEAALSAHQTAINTLNGDATTAGSVKKQVADAIAGVVDSAPEDFNTLKEIADYIASDKTNAAEINNDLAAIKQYSVNGHTFFGSNESGTSNSVVLAADDIEYSPASGPTSGVSDVQSAIEALDSATKTIQNTTIAGKALKNGNIALSGSDISYAKETGLTGDRAHVQEAIHELDDELSTLKSSAITSAEMAGDGGLQLAVANNKLTITTTIVDDAETVSDSVSGEKDLLSAYAVKEYVEAMLGWEQVTA